MSIRFKAYDKITGEEYEPGTVHITGTGDIFILTGRNNKVNHMHDIRIDVILNNEVYHPEEHIIINNELTDEECEQYLKGLGVR